MERLALIGGSYSARSIIANAQRCINLYPELNTKDALVPTTHYQRPGLVPLVTPEAAPVRALYRASTGTKAYAVVGSNVYSIDQNWAATLLGSITQEINTPCSMIDNGAQVLLVDGSPSGWTIDIPTNAFAQVADPTGSFVGANRVDYIDTFIIGNNPGTKSFFSTLSDSITFDPTFTASKTDYPDPIVSLIVNRHEILLLGQLKSEIWYDAGNSLFPFAELPGAYIEHGVAALYSVASEDINVYWLHQDLQGDGMVLRQRGYETKRISNHALEFAIEKMQQTTGIGDAIGYCYQIGGHVFYALHFPAGDQTWVYDDAMLDSNQAWHQEGWTDSNGILHRHRGNCFANIWGHRVCGDWQNGTLYSMDTRAFTDTVGGVEGPISFTRTFPHIGQMRVPGNPMLTIPTSGRRVQFQAIWIDLEPGNTQPTLGNDPPVVSVRWSDDKGRTFGNALQLSTGMPGDFLEQPQARQLGIARDRVFEVSYSSNGAMALNGAWVDGEVLDL